MIDPNLDSGKAVQGEDILVVDDTAENVRLVVGMLREAGYRARGVPNGEMALQAIAMQPPDLILLDIRMPGMDGFQVCQTLRENPDYRDIPIIFMSALGDMSDKVHAFQVGGEDYITKPFQAAEVLARVRTHLEIAHNRKALAQATNVLEQLTRERIEEAEVQAEEISNPLHVTPETGADILMVEDDPGTVRMMADILRQAGYKVHSVPTGEFALIAATKQPPDLILLDIRLPGMDGYEVCRELRRRISSHETPIIFLSQLSETIDKLRAFEVGAEDYINKPFHAPEVLARVNVQLQLRRMQQGLEQMVADLAVAIAQEMGLGEEQVHGLRLAGIVHDIGKINVPAEILSKPGRLSELEYALIKVHPKAGFDILKDIDFPWPIAQTVLQHHERMDGSGYPQGLKADAIILEARILAVADVVEAMFSHRPYRPGLGIEAALEEIQTNRGVLFDPVVVDACFNLFKVRGFTL